MRSNFYFPLVCIANSQAASIISVSLVIGLRTRVSKVSVKYDCKICLESIFIAGEAGRSAYISTQLP